MKKRVLYFDVLKIVAIFFVILIHIVSEYWDNLDVNSANFVWLSLFDSIARFCVPIYFMVSGAIFLNEEKKVTIKDVLKKYVPKVLIIFWVWNFVYNLVDVFAANKVVSVKIIGNIIVNTLLGKGIFHLYFLPIIIGFYLCLPILKEFTKKSNKDILKYLIVILFIFISVTKILKYSFNVSIAYPILFSGYFIYFILGYYLNTFEINEKNTKIIYLLGALGLVITATGAIVCSRLFGKTETFFNYLSFNVIFYSSAVFLFAKNKVKKFNQFLLELLTSTNFGMYLIHGLILGLLEYIGLFAIFDKLTVPIGVIVNCVLIYILSLALVFVLIKIPVVRNLVSLDKKR